MKLFDPIIFDRERCKQELDAFKLLLDGKEHLREREDILPFFQSSKHLSVLMGSFNPNIFRFDRVATEFNLFGDYACDLAVGCSQSQNYCFIEFEDASPTSIFVKKRGKSTSEWAPRFDHGFSQIIDWIQLIEDQQRSALFKSKFGTDLIHYVGLLVIGRRNGMNNADADRLRWRSENVRVGPRQVHCITFDDLYDSLRGKLEVMAGLV